MKKFTILITAAVCIFAMTGMANALNIFPDTGSDWTDVEGYLNYYGADYSPVKPVVNFSDEWNYTALAYENTHINIVKEGVNGSMTTTFSTADTSTFGEWETVDFDTENLKFKDTADGTKKVLDRFTNNKTPYFKLFELNSALTLGYLDNLVLSAGTIIVGFNDNGLDDSVSNFDRDYDDIIVAMKPVPEPGTIILLGLGLIGVVGLRRKTKK